MADLIGVVIGGALAVSGSAATQWYLHRARVADERRRVLERKLEELISLVYEYAHWMERMRGITVFGRDGDENIAPLAKLMAVAAIHFPAFLPGVKCLNSAGINYYGWMLKKGRQRLNGEMDQLTQGFDEIYLPFLNAQSALLDDLQLFAQREFGRTPQPNVT